MQEIFFLTRHIPFWAIPLIVLGVEFAYLYWLRKKKASVVFCLSIAAVGVLATGFYIWAGGPEKAVKIVKKVHREIK